MTVSGSWRLCSYIEVEKNASSFTHYRHVHVCIVVLIFKSPNHEDTVINFQLPTSLNCGATHKAAECHRNILITVEKGLFWSSHPEIVVSKNS